MRRDLTFALSLLLFAPSVGRAQQPSLRYHVRPWRDGAVVATAAAAALVPMLWPRSFAHATCAPCDPAALWPVDRGVVGTVRPAADAASTGTLGLEAALGTVFLLSSRRGQGADALMGDVTVIAQAVTITQAATAWAKILFHRPRPYLYASTATGPVAPEDGWSMPSGHTSVAFAAAAAYASVLHRRGLAGQNKVQIGVLFAAAATTGILRVVAHKHFPTDVVAGAALGFAIGWTIPAIHPTVP